MTDANSHPQPRTFAPSKEDVLQNLTYFFGQPVSPEKLKDYSEHHAMTYHFPDAYAGTNTKIRDTINNLVIKSPQSWQTSIGLPFFQITGTTIEWDEIRFDVRLMQRVPYEGVSRMQTSLRRRHRDRVVRRGLGLIIESDFYATDAGRQHFADQLTSIRYCVQETCNFDVLYAYLTCGNYDFNYDRAKNLRPKRNIKTAMQHEIMMYGCAQKEVMGLDKAVEECKYRMSRYGVTPNMLVIPPQLSLYMSLAPEEKLTYKEAGPAGQAAFAAGVAGFEAKAFRGCGVVTSDPYEVSDDQDSVQMLTRSTQIGEFYIMMPPQVKPTDGGKHTADLLIFDEESDKHVRISWNDAMYACCINQAAVEGEATEEELMAMGELPPADPPDADLERVMAEAGAEARAAGATEAEERAQIDLAVARLRNIFVEDRARALADRRAMVAAMADPAQEDGIRPETELHGGGNAGDWLAAAKQINNYNKGDEGVRWEDLNPNCRIILTRPFIEHLMHSAVLCVAGRDTGATLFGPADMQLSANTQVKTIEGHYTGHFKSVVTKPQNVYVMRDIACAGYVAGCNTRFFARNSEDAPAGNMLNAGNFGLSTARQNIMERLSFADDVGAMYGSMLAFPCWESQLQSGHLDTVLSVTTRLLPWEVQSAGGGTHNSFPGGQTAYTQYSQHLGLSSIHFGEDMKAAENMEFISQGSTNNATCFLGPHRRYDPFAKGFYSLEPGQGHFGPDAIPGDARWRRGETVSLKAARDSMVSLELASHAQMVYQKR